MGNTQETEINTEELRPYLKYPISLYNTSNRDGLSMDDLINLRRAFNSLDKDGTGRILYDVRKISDIDKYQLPVEDENGKVSIDFKQFMEIMTENIIKNREKFGREATTYESETSTVTCIICPFKR